MLGLSLSAHFSLVTVRATLTINSAKKNTKLILNLSIMAQLNNKVNSILQGVMGPEGAARVSSKISHFTAA